MSKNNKYQSLKLFFKSAFLTAIALILIALGFIAADFFFGG